MFRKVLIAEDMDNINKGLETTLSELGITVTEHVQYCDEAYLKIRKAMLDNQPYELLIADLSFVKDHRDQKLTSGEALIEAVKQHQPDIKVIVYSVEDRLQKVRKLMTVYCADAYVCKGRQGLKELAKAIQLVYGNKQYLSPGVAKALSNKYDPEINAFDLQLIKLLAEGWTQDEISKYLKIRKISPSSLSTIEKRIRRLKDQFRANSPAHLALIAKDQGLI